MPSRQRRRAVARGEDRPLLVVSNRLPMTFKLGQRAFEGQRSVGGLVSALEPVLRQRGGKWIGWAGTQLPRGHRLARHDDGYELIPVQISESEVQRYYHGFANRTLWPLFHSFPGLATFSRQDWQIYERVNQRFASVVAQTADARSLVWLHDYHLMLAPTHLRQLLPQARLAFFLHIPFPPYDLFRLLPWSRELLRGVLACDLIGFHVDNYRRNFLDCVEQLLRSRVDRNQGLVEYGNRTVRVGAFPIGIDFDYYERQALAAARTDVSRGEKLVLGVDRLDYTKGIPERILAFERLLELYPEHRERVVFLQLAVPSRVQVAEYGDLKRQIDELVGRINGRFSTASWAPIRYLYQSLPPERLCSLYRDADVAFITPGRDGMNLVAKEFVASQVAEPGVLVLSRLAGAAETMHEAVLVNPYDLDRTANALHRALTMELEERRSRMAALRRREQRYNIAWWVEQVLEAAQAPQESLARPTQRDFESWLFDFIDEHHLAVFLGLDGVLAMPNRRGALRLSPATRAALEACARRNDTDLAIVGGRPLPDVRRIVSLPDITYGGLHGMAVSGRGIPGYEREEVRLFSGRLEDLTAELATLSRRVVERDGLSLRLDLADVPASEQESLVQAARQAITRAGFQFDVDARSIVARLPVVWDVSHAIHHIVRQRYGPLWSEKVRIVYVGGDGSSEDTFRALRGLGITIRVGETDALTDASRRLPDVDAVRDLLVWLAERPRRRTLLESAVPEATSA